MNLTNKQYDTLKGILIKGVPALIVLIGSLGTIYNFEELANTINLTIGAFGVFLTTILGISSKSYNSSDEDVSTEEE